MVNYAVLYGKTSFTLAKDIGALQLPPMKVIDAYFQASHWPIKRFCRCTLAEARVSGVVKTLDGRRRLVPELNSRDFQRRTAAEREVVNMPIQCTAAEHHETSDDRRLTSSLAGGRDDARMILTVHDESAVRSANRVRADDVAELVKSKMEAATALDVPLIVDVGIGPNWKEAKG